MRLLAIDTSHTENFSLAISEDYKILASKESHLNAVLSNSIIQQIDQLLKKANLKLHQLDGFVVGLGPGSFTSLRVGLSTIKAFCMATKRPLIGISSLDALAMNTHYDGQVCTLLDAKRNLIYACLYDKKKGKLVRKSDYVLTSLEEFIKKIKGEVMFIGDGINMSKAALSNHKENKLFKFEKKENWFPKASYLVPLGRKRFEKKNFDDVSKLVPLYLYPADCQVRR